MARQGAASHRAMLHLGLIPNVELEMGLNSWYNLQRTVALKAHPTKLKVVGKVSEGDEVRVDMVYERTDGVGKDEVGEDKNCVGLWSHIAEPKSGWVPSKALVCRNQLCGCCHACSNTKLPSENLKEQQIDKTFVMAARLEQAKVNLHELEEELHGLETDDVPDQTQDSSLTRRLSKLRSDTRFKTTIYILSRTMT